MSTLETAIAIACEAHNEQVDKAAQPYVLHPLRVMLRFDDNEARIAAVLHDAVEDGGFTVNDLRAVGFSEEVLEAVDYLTRREEQSYDEYIARLSTNALARRIKIEDLKDNLDPTRLGHLREADMQRLQRYHRSLRWLESIPMNAVETGK